MKETQLPLGTVLDRLKDCPAKNKLLVLDIMRNMLDPLDLGGSTGGVGDLVLRELQDEQDPKKLNDTNLMVICACSPGESSLGSESLGRSAFSYYFERGLTEAEADNDHDNLVSAQELAKYLTEK